MWNNLLDVSAALQFSKCSQNFFSGCLEQHGSSATTNMNVYVISPEKVSASTRRRYETQVCDAQKHRAQAILMHAQ